MSLISNLVHLQVLDINASGGRSLINDDIIEMIAQGCPRLKNIVLMNVSLLTDKSVYALTGITSAEID